MNIGRAAQIIVVSVVFFKQWQNSSWCVLALIYSSTPLQWAWGGLSVLLLQEACQDIFVHVSWIPVLGFCRRDSMSWAARAMGTAVTA